jgi:hypothetical protein
MLTFRSPYRAAALGLLALAGCCSTAAPPAAPSAASPPAASQPDARTQAQQLIGDAACSDNSQCRTIGWGAKACGGPQHWVAFSTTRTDAAALEQLAQQEAARQRAEQQRRGIVSNCQYVADPGAQCLANRCVLRQGRGAVAQ